MLLFIFQSLFGNIKIARFFISIVVDCLICNTNYYQLPILESIFIDFIQSISFYMNNDVLYTDLLLALVQPLFL